MQLGVLNAAVRYRVLNVDKSHVLKESREAGTDFVLKEGVAIPALPIALKTMKKGEKASLILKPGCELLPPGHCIRVYMTKSWTGVCDTSPYLGLTLSSHA